MAGNHHELRRLGQVIHLAREERGLNASDLSTVAGIDETVLVAVENGQHDPDFDLLLRLADAMNTRVSAFVLKAEDLARAEAEDRDVGASRRPIAIRWRSRQSFPNTRDIEAGLTLTFSGRLMRFLTSWRFPKSHDDESR